MRRFGWLAGALALTLLLGSAPVPEGPTIIVAVGGNNQVGVPGVPLASPFEAAAYNASGNPMPGVRVTFTAPPGSVFLVPDVLLGTIDTKAGGGFGGDGVPGPTAILIDPVDVAASENGIIYVADRADGRIRSLDAAGNISTVAGGGTQPFSLPGQPATQVGDLVPRSLDVGPFGDVIFVDEPASRVFRLDPASGALYLAFEGGALVDAVEDYYGNLYLADGSTLLRIEPDGTPTAITSFSGAIRDIEHHPDGRIAVAHEAGITLVSAADGSETNYAPGDTTAVEADAYGALFFSQAAEHRVRHVPLEFDIVAEVAGTGTQGYSGDDGPAPLAQTSLPHGLAVDADGNAWFADRGNAVVRKIEFQKKAVQQVSVYTNAFGIARSALFLPGGTSGSVTASVDGVVGLSTQFSFVDPNPPGGPPSEPDPVQSDRVTNIEKASLFPRWTRLEAIFDYRGSNPSEPMNFVFQSDLAVDRAGVVHVVGRGYNEAGEPVLVYTNNAWETRGARGFGPLFVVAELSDVSPAAGSPTDVSVAIGPDDALHVVWHDHVDLDDPQIDFKTFIRYRKLDPAEGWLEAQTLYEAVTETPVFGPTTSSHEEILGSPRIAVDTGGTVHIAAPLMIHEMTINGTDWTNKKTFRILYSQNIGAFAIAREKELKIQNDAGETTLTGEGLVPFVFGSELVDVEAQPEGDARLAYWSTFVEQGESSFNLILEKSTVQTQVGLGSAVSVFPPAQVEALMGGERIVEEAFDMAVDADGGAHFVVQERPKNISDDNPNVLYRKLGEPIEKVNDDHHAQSPRVLVDSRNRPHVFWLGRPFFPPGGEGALDGGDGGGGGAVGGNGIIIIEEPPIEGGCPLDPPVGPSAGAYATKPINPNVTDGAWRRQEPMQEHGGQLFTITSVALGPGDVLHAIDASLCYFRNYEPNLGAQDDALMVPWGPGASANAGNGNVLTTRPLFGAAGVGYAVNLSLIHNSLDLRPGPVGPGWRHNYQMTVTDYGDVTDPHGCRLLSLSLGDGRRIVFRTTAIGAETYVDDPEFGGDKMITRLIEGDEVVGYELLLRDGQELLFRTDGKLSQIRDTQTPPNTLRLIYSDEPGSGATPDEDLTERQFGPNVHEVLPSEIKDSASSRPKTKLKYDTLNRLVEVNDPAGKVYSITPSLFGPTSVEMPEGVTWSFEYYAENDADEFARAGFPSLCRTPRGTAENFEWELQYYSDNRAAACVSPTETYVKEGSALTESVAAAMVLIYSDPSPGGTVVDHVATLINKRNHPTVIAYEPRRNLAEKVIDAQGHSVERVILGFPGEIDGFRNIGSVTDRGSLKETGGLKNTTVFTYFDEGPPGFEHVHNNVKTILKPGTTQPVTYAYEDLNRVGTFTDARGNTWDYDHDGDGNRTAVKHPVEPEIGFSFDPETGTITPQEATGGVGAIHQAEYDDEGRPTKLTNASGGVTEIFYEDPVTGLATQVKLPDHEKTWKYERDVMGNMLKRHQPEGGFSESVRDGLYRTVAVKQPSVTVAGGATVVPTTTIAYNPDSMPTAATDPAGKTATTVYNKLGWATQSIDRGGFKWKSGFDRNGNLVRSTDANGNVTVGEFDSLDRLVRTVAPGPPPLVVEYEHDPNGNVTVLREGAVGTRESKFLFNARNKGVLSKLPELVTVRREVDANDNVTLETVIGPTGAPTGGVGTLAEVEFVVDKRNRVSERNALTAIDAAPAVTKYRYNPDSLLSLTTVVIDGTEENDRTVAIARDKANVVTGGRDGEGGLWARKVDDNLRERETFVPAPEGVEPTHPGGLLRVRTIEYDHRNMARTEADALGNTVSVDPDVRGDVVRTVDRRGALTEVVYDARRLAVAVHRHVNDAGLGTLTTTRTFDGDGNVLSLKDPRGNPWTYAYDGADRRTLIKSPLGFTRSYSYTEFGELSMMTDGIGETAVFGYDNQGRNISETHTLGGSPTAAIIRGYDGASRRIVEEDVESGIRVETDYELRGLPEEVRWFVGGEEYQTLTYAYDAGGSRTSAGGPGADLFVYQRNRRAQLTAILHNGTIYDQMTYDAAGRPTEGTLANGVETTIEYTARGERKRVTAMLGDQMLTDFIWGYDANGNVAQETQGHVGATRTMQYMHNTDWALSEVWANGITDESAFTYDAGGNRLTKMRNGAGAVYSYDADNRLQGEARQVPVGTEVVQQTGAVAVDSTKPGRNPAVIADGNTADSAGVPHAWMAQETATTHWAAIVFSTPKPVDTIGLWIPTAGQPALPPNANPNAQPPGAPASGLTSFRLEVKVGGAWGPPADATVTGATGGGGFYSTTAHAIVATFEEQEVEGVRVLMAAGGGSPAHANRLMVNELQAFVTMPVFEAKQIDYAFDGNGNMVGRTVTGADDEIESAEAFGYRYDDRLESYLGPAGFYTYLHTPGGQRINKTNVTAGAEQWFKYDGPDVISDNTRTSGASEFNLEATYVQLLSIDSKQVRLGADGSQRYYLGAGSIARIVDGAGSVLETLVNTMFGEDIVGPTLGDRHGFQRRERNAEMAILGGTAMYDYRQRIGDPGTGRFIQLDPLNPEGDHYALANNNPLRFTDPEGLQGIGSALSPGGVQVDPLGIVFALLRSSGLNLGAGNRVLAPTAVYAPPPASTPEESLNRVFELLEIQASGDEIRRAIGAYQAQGLWPRAVYTDLGLEGGWRTVYMGSVPVSGPAFQPIPSVGSGHPGFDFPPDIAYPPELPPPFRPKRVESPGESPRLRPVAGGEAGDPDDPPDPYGRGKVIDVWAISWPTVRSQLALMGVLTPNLNYDPDAYPLITPKHESGGFFLDSQPNELRVYSSRPRYSFRRTWGLVKPFNVFESIQNDLERWRVQRRRDQMTDGSPDPYGTVFVFPAEPLGMPEGWGRPIPVFEAMPGFAP